MAPKTRAAIQRAYQKRKKGKVLQRNLENQEKKFALLIE